MSEETKPVEHVSLTIQEYQQLTPKTIKYLGFEHHDCNHMIIGMFSEINELMDALQSGDYVNILEELGDFSWYHSNYSVIRKITLNPTPGMYGLMDLIYTASKLSDVVKKLLIYNREIDREQEISLVQSLGDILESFYYNLEPLDIKKARAININKLHNVRYKNATYSDVQANTRELTEERKTLEGGLGDTDVAAK